KCGSPVIGTTLNGKYTYYRCRGTWPTATRAKICDAGYIKADELEVAIWRKLLEMLFSPLTLLRTLINQRDEQPNKAVEQLTKQINGLRKKLKAYPRKEKTLYELLPHEAVTKDYVLDAVNNLKEQRLSDERQLQLLLQTRKEATAEHRHTLRLSEASLDKMRQLAKYQPFSDTILHPYMDDFEKRLENHLDEILFRRRSLFESIRLKVLADLTGYQFNFTLQGVMLSTTNAEELSYFDDLEAFEEQNPDICISDLLDPNKLVPGDTPFVKKVNQLKENLATIERTWA
ncbi:recombinase zinc beta ribbon domain-containing protein, partial [Chloroflexota bacterium]